MSSLRNAFNNLSLSLFLIAREFKANLVKFGRQYVLLALILSVVIMFFSAPSAYRFLRTGQFETAEYDIVIRGPLTDADLLKLKRFEAVEEIVGASVWVTDLVNPRSGKSAPGRVYFVTDMEIASRLLPSNRHLLMKGTFEKKGAVLSAKVANALGVGIGDTVGIAWRSYNLKAVEKYTVRYKVTGILYPTADPNEVIVDMQNASQTLARVKDLLNPGQPSPRYDAAFLKLDKSRPGSEASVAGILSKEQGSLAFGKRNDQLRAEKAEAARLQRSQYWFMEIGALFLYALLFVWYALASINQRKKLYAIICACGASLRLIYTHFLVDILGLFLAVTAASIYLSNAYFRYFLSFYVPPAVAREIFVLVLLINAGVGMVILIFSLRKLAKLPLAELLVKE
jgi:hypothetical protein